MTTSTNVSKHTLMIVDDEAITRQNLAHALRKDGYNVLTCADGAAALAELARHPCEVVLTDLRMPGVDGIALLTECRRCWPQIRVIIFTGYASIDNAVAAMKAGAFHYLAKPFHLDEVRELVKRALEVISLEQENQILRQQLKSLTPQNYILTQNKAMLALLETARRIASTDCSVLISGESGTGKELLARFIQSHSLRRDGPYVAINCGALPGDLLANELFGHDKGAFTGAQTQKCGLIEKAHKGTLFLDEIAETSPNMQVSLLRVIEARELFRVGSSQPTPVDVRFIAATNRDMTKAVSDGSFRQDLYFRLNVVELHLPSLVNRRDDIPLLARHFLLHKAAKLNRPGREMTARALDLLVNYDYPGNIRELANMIERAVALASEDIIDVCHLPEHLRAMQITVVRPSPTKLPTLDEQERHYILQVLEHTGYNRSQTSQILGIDRVSLWRKLKRYGVEGAERGGD